VRVMNYSDYTNKVDVNSMKQIGVLNHVHQRTKQEFTSCHISNMMCNGFFMEYNFRRLRSIIPKNKKVFYRQLLGYITCDLCKLGLTYRILINY
jgi:hypothetical protein